MNRSLLAAPAVAALLLTGVAGIASAQEDPPPLSVTGSEGTCGRVTLSAASLAGTYEIAVYAGPNAGGAASDPIGQFTVTAEGVATKTFTLPEDAYDGSGFVSWATVSGPEQNAWVHGAVGVATDCAPPAEETPDPEPTDEPEPSTDPEPTPTATPTPPVSDTPAPPAQIPAGPPYADCDAARADGAAPIMVGDPGYRPALDRDGDGVACDEDRDSDGGSPAVGDAVLGGSDDSNSGIVDRIPAGSIDTGYVA